MKRQAAKECPIDKVVGLLGDPCSILIVRDLLEGPKRFGELEKSLSSSTRTLTKKLKLLEHEKLVMRRANKEAACVQYTLTKKGTAFHGVVDEMRAYGKKYL
jgi:DNA-binding HxlR family transcriptional regulator